MLRFLRKSKRGSGRKEPSLEARLQAMEARLRALEAAVGGQEGDGADLEKAPELAEETAKEEGLPDIDLTEDCEQCVIGESIWDSPAIMGLPGFGGRFTTVLLLMTLLASISLQVFFCHTLVTNSTFYNPDFWQKQLQTAKKWRASDGHDSRFNSLQGVSLVSRVCTDDSSLSVANGQRDLLGDIENYMDDDVLWRATGPRLAMVCIILFALMVMEEQKGAILSIRALLTLPNGDTCIRENHLVSISKVRLAASLVAGLVRLAISIAVLCAGVVWLATTAKASDLVLNNAALGFVFAIDELLVNALVPAAMQNRLRTMEPVRVRRLPLHLEAVLPWFFTAATAAVAALLLLQPQAADMAAARDALCAGRREFTVFGEPEGVVTHAYTMPASLEITNDLRALAVQELSSSDPQDKAIDRAYSLQMVNGHGSFGETQESTFACFDVSEGSSWAVEALKWAAAQHGVSISSAAFTCADYGAFCRSDLVRRLCPQTCGCKLEPWSPLFVDSGCAQSCKREGQRLAASRACSNHHVPAGYLSELRPWHVMGFKGLFPADMMAAHLEFLDTALAGSCDAAGLQQFCDSDSVWLASFKGSPVHRFCPELCCNGNYTDPQGLCPRSCPASARSV